MDRQASINACVSGDRSGVLGVLGSVMVFLSGVVDEEQNGNDDADEDGYAFQQGEEKI